MENSVGGCGDWEQDWCGKAETMKFGGFPTASVSPVLPVTEERFLQVRYGVSFKIWA
jgi:hypothetical protein